MQLLRGKGGPVDAVFADPSADHHNQITDSGLLVLGWLTTHQGGHKAHGAAKDQGFAGKTLVKNQRAVNRGNPAFVAAVLNPQAHPFKNPLGVQ